MKLPKRRATLSGGQIEVRSERERRRANAKLERLVKLAEPSSSGDSANPLDVQLLARVAGSASFPAFKTAHGNAWRQRRLPYGVGGWPDAIAEGELAVVVLPLAAGRVGLAAGKQPKPIATPMFVTGRPRKPGGYDDIVLAAVLSWLEDGRGDRPVRLAPPVVEIIQRGAVAERHLAEFGLSWSLPPSDGV